MSSYGQRRSAGPANRSTRRILQLKTLVDRIINQCSIESKEVRQGLQSIKDYQLDMLEEIRDLPEEEEEDSYAPRNRGYEVSARPTMEQRDYGESAAYSDNDRTVHALKEELQIEARNTNKMAQNYRNLEGDYQKLKREYDRLARRGNQQQLDESSNEGDAPPRYTRQPVIRERPTQQFARYEAPSRPRIDSSENEVERLREELREAYALIEELRRKLGNANEQIARLKVVTAGNQDGHGSAKLHKQLQSLKQQNEELRKETIQLLKRKDKVGGSGRGAQLQQEIDRLNAEIEKENEAKKLFIRDMEKYKRTLMDLQEENKRLKEHASTSQHQSQYTLGNPINITSDYNYDTYAYNNTVPVFGSSDNSKLDKYKSFLNTLKGY